MQSINIGSEFDISRRRLAPELRISRGRRRKGAIRNDVQDAVGGALLRKTKNFDRQTGDPVHISPLCSLLQPHASGRGARRRRWGGEGLAGVGGRRPVGRVGRRGARSIVKESLRRGARLHRAIDGIATPRLFCMRRGQRLVEVRSRRATPRGLVPAARADDPAVLD